jgi:F-type H+-transporting ATPase subunit c
MQDVGGGATNTQHTNTMTTDLLLLAEAATQQFIPLSGNFTFGIAGAGAAIGIGLIGARATEAVGRNPGSFGRALTMAIIFTALAEAMGIFGLVFAFQGK